MAGCFSNHWVDRHLEAELMRHLADEERIYCTNCEEELKEENCEWDDEDEVFICPHCERKING